MKKYISSLVFIASVSVYAEGGQLLRSIDFGEKWPLTVSEGVVECLDRRFVIFRSGGKSYGVNGAAKSNGYPSIDPIWKYDPDTIKFQKELAEIEKTSLKEIQEQMGTTPRISIGPILDAGLKLCK